MAAAMPGSASSDAGSTSSTAPVSSSASVSAAAADVIKPPFSGQRKLTGGEGKYEFVYMDRTVYTWEQSLEEVIVYVVPPPGTTAKMVDCEVTMTHFRLGLKGNPPFLSADFSSKVVVDESYWMMGDGRLTVNLQKAVKAETWPCVFKGHGELDAATVGEEQKTLMLERFQAEHPGFDFSGAEFSGSAPDPRTFMGGVHKR